MGWSRIAFVVFFLQELAAVRPAASTPVLTHGHAAAPRPPAGALVARPCTIGRMFERTALPSGPRVISARVPGARSVSIAAYVLAGSRLESAGETGVAHFMEHITFKGTAAYPSTRAISEAIEGVGGSFNAATDRESTVYWVRVPRREAARAMDVLGELIVRPTLAEDEIESERERDRRGDPLATSTTRPSTARSCSRPRCSATGRSAARSAATRSRSARCPAAHDPRLLADDVPPGATRSSRVAGDLGHDEAVELAAGAFGTGNGVVPGFAPAPALPAGPRVADSASATPRRRSSASASRRSIATTRTAGRWPSSTRVLGDGMSSRLFLSVREERGLAYDVCVRDRRLRRRRRARGLGRGGPGRARRGPRRDPGRARAAARRAGPAPTSWPRPSAYLSGGLELRMDETRHVASWIGGQEALHDRVLTLEEALAAVDGGRRRRRPARSPPTLVRDDALRLAAVAPARYLRGLDARLRLPG